MSLRVPRIVEESVRAIMTLLLIVMSYLIIMVVGMLYEEHQRVLNQPVQTSEERTIEELRAAHKRHGINWSYKDGDTWFFIRNGQKCKVFAYKEKQD